MIRAHDRRGPPFAHYFVLFAVLLVGYGTFEARRIIEGPVVTIYAPKDGSATSTTGVVISGNAQNISFLTINDKPSSLPMSKGNFSESCYLFHPGLRY